jgi:predicted secreted protein
MNWISSLAIYFIMWWLVFFAVLPLGIRSAHEAGESIGAGHEPGAPVQPMLLRKAAMTTVIAALIFALFYVAKTRGWLGF